VLELDSGVDYRLRRLKDITVYHAPLGPRADAALDGAFAELTEGSEPAPDSLHYKGRVIAVPLAARGVARFSFARSEENTSELQSLMRISYAVFCLKQKHN